MLTSMLCLIYTSGESNADGDVDGNAHACGESNADNDADIGANEWRHLNTIYKTIIIFIFLDICIAISISSPCSIGRGLLCHYYWH